MHRIWVIGSVLAMVAVVALGWLLGVAPQLAAADAANLQRQSVEAQNATAAQLVAKLKSEDAADLRTTLAELRRSVPKEAQIGDFITQVSKAAEKSHVTVTSFSVGEPQQYTPPVAAPATKPAAEAAPTSSPTPAPATGSAPATASPAPAGPVVLPTTNAKITSSNFITIQITLAVTGTDEDVLDFTHAMQTGQRMFLVNTFTSARAPGAAATTAKSAASPAPAVTATIGGYVYVLLGSGPTASAVSTTQDASQSPAPTTAGTPAPAGDASSSTPAPAG